MNERLTNLHELPKPDRYQIIDQAKNHLAQKCRILRPDFSVIAHGSSVYGYKETSETPGGKYDDVDCLVVVPGKGRLPYPEFKHQVELLNITPPTQDVYELALNSKHMFRLQGSINLVKVGFHCIPQQQFCSMTDFPGEQAVFNLFPNKNKYREKKYIEPHLSLDGTSTSKIEIVREEDAHLLVRQYLYHAPSNQSSSKPKLGVLADKWLTAEPLYVKDQVVARSLEKLFTNFVRAILFYQPNATIGEIINVLFRSNRFSQRYVKQLSSRIKAERQRLKELKRACNTK
jgi:hypothetical protein